ncbi:hypothetical protein [Sabulicella glaciei]|uniref:Uncharacterized protein n=1 Tax=Sabulicella glaciei TaxID=2984948 RepID=A0ABT3NVA6_9PROT|nr:hypothetical protein [Roseococcus sp. MDT2-1-1]MCW8086097.1 hypothetical protein [Roseococcus sp. MDT2-1-1]
MADPIEGVERHGRLYWCIKTDLAPDGKVHLMADRMEVTSSGALIAWGSFNAKADGPSPEPVINLVCAPGRWFAAYVASGADGSGLAVQSWAGEPNQGRNRAADAERRPVLREVPHETR